MPGRQLHDPRLGSSSELLAQFILNRLAFTAKVPREEDVGHDFVCSLAKREGRFVKAGGSFSVQVKSRKEHIHYNTDAARAWIRSQENPFFICVVNRRKLLFELFSTWNMINAFLHRGEDVVDDVVLIPKDTREPHRIVYPKPGTQQIFGSSAEFVGKTVFHRRLRRPRCSPSLKASLASSAAVPALTLGCAPRCRLVWAMGNGASGGGSGHRV